jgi:hypothetical protein
MILHRINHSIHSSRRSLRQALWLALLLAGSALSLSAQKGPQPPPPGMAPPIPPPPPVFDNSVPNYGPPPVHVPTFEEKQYMRYLESRLKSVASDTNKMLELAKELNRETDPSKAGALSPEDLRTIAKIEKLARNVKSNMSVVADATQAH